MAVNYFHILLIDVTLYFNMFKSWYSFLKTKWSDFSLAKYIWNICEISYNFSHWFWMYDHDDITHNLVRPLITWIILVKYSRSYRTQVCCVGPTLKRYGSSLNGCIRTISMCPYWNQVNVGPMISATQQTQNICITFVQRRPNVLVRPNIVQMLYKYFVFAGQELDQRRAIMCSVVPTIDGIHILAALARILCLLGSKCWRYTVHQRPHEHVKELNGTKSASWRQRPRQDVKNKLYFRIREVDPTGLNRTDEVSLLSPLKRYLN